MDLRPLIGITCDYEPSTEQPGRGDTCRQPANYHQALQGAGALPVLLPAIRDESLLAEYVARLDGIVFSGADDLPPECYGEATHAKTKPMSRQRYEFEWPLARLALAHGRVPLLGICGGCQLLSTVTGGTLIQDIPDEVPGALSHRSDVKGRDARHEASFAEGSRLTGIFAPRAEINSSHHQSIERLGEGLRVIARSDDGVVEAIELPGARYVVGVQWHPERCLDLPGQKQLVEQFVEECRKYMSARTAGAVD